MFNANACFVFLSAEAFQAFIQYMVVKQGMWYLCICLYYTLQAGPFSISSQSTSWQLSVKSEIMNRTHNSLSMHCQKQYPNDVGQYVCWHVNWCLWPPKLGGHRILLGNIDFDTVLILIGTLYSTCIWLFLSDYMGSSTTRQEIGKVTCLYNRWDAVQRGTFPERCKPS